MAQPIEQLANRRLRRRLFEFGEIGNLELFPMLGITMEAAAQRAARGYFLQPQLDLRSLPRQAARPQPIDQYANAVLRIGRLIDALHPQRGPGHFAPATTIKVEVPWASTRPSRDVSRASVEMIWRVCDTTWASALTIPVSLVIGRERLTLVPIVRNPAPAGISEYPAHPVALSINVMAQPPWVVPIGLSRWSLGSPSKAANPSPISTSQNVKVCDMGGAAGLHQ